MSAPMPWFRLYNKTLNSKKVQSLPAAKFKMWINTLCHANQQNERGAIGPIDEYAFSLRITEAKARELLIYFCEKKLVEQRENKFFMHDWDEHNPKSDDVNARVANYRDKKRNNESTNNNQLDDDCNVTGNGKGNDTSNGQEVKVDKSKLNKEVEVGKSRGNGAMHSAGAFAQSVAPKRRDEPEPLPDTEPPPDLNKNSNANMVELVVSSFNAVFNRNEHNTPSNRRLITQHIAAYENFSDIEEWRGYFRYCKQSDFLMGRTKPRSGHTNAFRLTLGGLISMFESIDAGQYHDEQQRAAG